MWGINGFGRIGRLVLRIAAGRGIYPVAINDIVDIDVSAYLFKYDSAHGRFSGSVDIDGDYLVVNGHRIRYFKFSHPSEIPWDVVGARIVIESTGKFTDRDAEKHRADKVIITAPAKKPDITVVLGVNDSEIKPSHRIISNASCTTNCFGIMVKVLHSAFGIERGELTTIHAYTNDQRIVDAPHKDKRRARAGGVNIIPTSTGAAKAIYEIFPELKGKLTALAIRVPTLNVSICDFSCEVKKKTTAEEVNKIFKEKSYGELKKYLLYTEDEIVSSDVMTTEYSAVFDAKITEVVDGNFVKVLAWYDNEYGYSARVVDLLQIVMNL